MKNRYRQQGFTLIELMIVVALIGVLAAIAYPSYQRYVIKTKRTDMMTEMQNIASQIESQKLAMGRYTDIPLASVLMGNVTAGTVSYPATNSLYDVSIWDASTTNAEKMIGNNITNRQWEIRAVPRTAKQMANDGTLTLNAQGLKCRGALCGTGKEWNN
nr:prepilin-type N-terminal cleavage/methylation domain-containing protein [Moraxella sp. CTOTU47616]